jgi:hypothetical protein
MSETKHSKKSKQRRMLDLSISTKAGTIALSIDDTGVTNATDLFTSAAHGFSTGDRILFTEDNTLPTGLTDATQYYVIASSDDTFQLATTYANAVAGTQISLSSDGTGANSYDLVEEMAGVDLQQMSGNVQATAVGTYKFNFPAGTFYDADAYEIQLTSHQRDTVLSEDRSARTSTSFTVLVDSLDETAALVDGFFTVFISGSSIEDRY